MMRFLFFPFLFLLFISCNNDDDSELNDDIVGTWKLTEVLADPGNGSGEFRAVNSQKTITLLADGTITSNGNLCSMSPEATDPTTGIYSIETSTFQADGCDSFDEDFGYPFDQDGKTLIISYPCFEPCKAKYKKIENIIF